MNPALNPEEWTVADAVEQARKAVLACGGLNWREDTNAAMDTLIAAVRVEEGARFVETVNECRHLHCSVCSACRDAIGRPS